MSATIPSSQKENSYRVLRDRILSMGLLEKQPRYYWITGISIVGMLLLGFYFLATVHTPLLQLLNILFLAWQVPHKLEERSKPIYAGII